MELVPELLRPDQASPYDTQPVRRELGAPKIRDKCLTEAIAIPMTRDLGGIWICHLAFLWISLPFLKAFLNFELFLTEVPFSLLHLRMMPCTKSSSSCLVPLFITIILKKNESEITASRSGFCCSALTLLH